MVEAYGTPMPINQVAAWYRCQRQLYKLRRLTHLTYGLLVRRSRHNQQLGLNPMDDGRVVRVPVPPPTEERRRDLAKQVGERLEQCNAAARRTS